MKALVTGGGGFVGGHLVAHLRAAGDDVVVADRRGPHSLDIVDRDAVHERFARERPRAVYHLAALTHVGESWSDPTAVLRVNVEGTQNVCDAAIAAGVDRVLVVGSAEEYGLVQAADLPLREDAPLRPSTPYGASKVAASFVALQAHLGGGLATIRTRSFNHTGPGQSDRFLIAALARRIATAERDGLHEVTIGSTDPVRDLTDVRDVVRAYRLATLEGAPGAVYNVCSGVGTTVGELADRMLALATRPLELVTDPAFVRPVDVPQLVGDPSALRAATGWAPTVTLDETLRAMLDEARVAVRDDRTPGRDAQA